MDTQIDTQLLDIFDEDWAEEFTEKVETAGFITLTQAKVLDMIDEFTDRETSRNAEQFCREVLGHDPWSVPLDIMGALDKPAASVAVKACHASSKGLALDTPIPTPTGWTTMGELREGDVIFDEAGKPTTVLIASDIHHRPCYRVHFSDGSSLVADDEHRWSVLRFRKRRTRRESARRARSLLKDWRLHWSLSETVQTTGLIDMTRTGWGQRDASIPLAQALDLPDADLPIPPYTLGAWLGDGTSASAALTTMDADILSQIEADGYTCRLRPSQQNSKASAYGILGLHRQLRENNLLNNKHIPDCYLRASRAQRLELLRGLMDTDGTNHLGDGSVCIVRTHDRLGRQIAELIRSLGWAVTVKQRQTASGKMESSLCFMPTDCPFRLERKRMKWNPGSQRIRSTHRFITSVEAVDSVPTKCITVDSPRSLYLAGEHFIPTHNTFSSAEIALYYVCERQALVITTAPTEQQVKKLLWAEIRKFHANAKEPLGGYLLEKELRYSTHNYAIGFSTDQAVRFSGFHGDLVVIIVDEAPGLREEIYDAIEGVRAGGDVRLLLIGNPVISGGTFEEAFKAKRGFWTTFTIDAYDTPNLVDLNLSDPEQEQWFMNLTPGTEEFDDVMSFAPRPYLITRQWVYNRMHEWGTDDPRYISRVRGGFPPFDEDSMFNLTWLEQARVRKANLTPGQANSLPTVLTTDHFEAGLDIAGDGADETVLCIREGPKIHGIWSWSKGDTIGEVTQICRKYQTLASIRGKRFRLKYDMAGDGYHYGKVLKENRIPVVGIHAQHAPLDPLNYVTLKDEMYGTFRDLLRDGYICELKDDEVISQATPIKRTLDTKGRVKVESKESLKKRGFKSPDHLEAVVFAFAKTAALTKGKNKRIFAGRKLNRS